MSQEKPPAALTFPPVVTGRFRAATGEMILADGDGERGFGVRNESTRVMATQPPGHRSAPQPLPLRDIFRARLGDIRRLYLGTPQTGVMVCAVDAARGAVTAHATLLTPESGAPAHLTIGRHERCQFRVTDPALSLRHAQLVVRRLPTGDVRVRLMDLRTGLGLLGEDGRPLESVSVEGHLFVGVGRYVLMVLQGGEDLAFSEDGGVVFDALPPRVFFDTREKVMPVSGRRVRLVGDGFGDVRGESTGVTFASGTRAGARARGIKDFHSRVSIHRPPEPLRDGGILGGDQRGTLTVTTSQGQATVPVYDAQVRDGVLLGRYERCESSDLPLELPDTVSRVHALVLGQGDSLFVMDTASTFGVLTQADEEVPGLKLDGPGSFMLGPDTQVGWTPHEG
jgi:hypothetical protein